MMQFLVYLTVLMVSISTVLLEVHWLTTPPPHPTPAVQAAAAPPPRPKVEGPNAALSPVYPIKPDQQSLPAPAAETTGVASRMEEAHKPVANTTTAPPNSAENAQASAPAQPESTASSNRCDIQACSSAYKSFRASDCTYQPNDGPRRICSKSTEQRAAREQREESKRRSSNREVDSREEDRRMRWRSYRDNDVDDDSDSFFLFRRGSRW